MTRRPPGRLVRLPVLVLTTFAVVAAGCRSAPPTTPAHRSSAAPVPSATALSSTAPSTARSSTVPSSTVPSRSAPRRAAPALPAARVRTADAAIRRLTGYLGAGGVSIEVRDLRSGATYRYGAGGGMLSGSISKLYILEVLLLQRQRKDDDLDGSAKRLAAAMIESSDNEAADDLYERIGEAPALRRYAATLGVRNTVPGPGILWGFNRTCAADYVALLRNLTRPGVLAAWARTYARGLLSKVETDQRWGVSAAADRGTHPLLKNGWLGASPDDFRWLVNSVGLITAHGRPLAVAVLTQHGRDFAGGVTLVGKLARISVRAVTGP